MTEQTLTTEERFDVLETVLQTLLLGALQDKPDIQRQLAEHLNTAIEASQRHQTRPAHVLHELQRYADALVMLDSVAAPLRPFLRP